MNCRHCNTPLEITFCNLQTCPPSNAMVKEENLAKSETYYPLNVQVCTKCWLVQVDELEKATNIFNEEYTYFSSYSKSWLVHSKEYVDYVTNRFFYNQNSQIIEIASNDGYLLQYFKEKNIPVLGVEPTANTAAIAKSKGIDSIVDFFGVQLAESHLKSKADLILGNNVLAHVPDINDFVKGVKIALKPQGVNTFEFPHLCKLVAENQFDTIYHEHFSYLSFTAVNSIFSSVGLEIFDVQELETHGGSLRIFAKHKEDTSKNIEVSVMKMLDFEEKLGVKTKEYYEGFQNKINQIKYYFTKFLIEKKLENKKIVGYGAAAKGNTLLNFCGIKGNDLIDYVVDASPFKQNKFLPGSRIPVCSEEELKITKPDYIVIFPWNLKKEIVEQLNYCRTWGAKFIVAIPELTEL